jgi:starvation-inducible DNA-binding protein
VPPYPRQIAGWREHVEALSSALAAFGTSVREAIDQSAEFGDIDTSDLFTEISRATDKYLWFVEAHLHG